MVVVVVVSIVGFGGAGDERCCTIRQDVIRATGARCLGRRPRGWRMMVMVTVEWMEPMDLMGGF